ncbi:MAG TPA: ABC transporter substrate-binding protein [Herpetosiphonaceae bacterium]
MRVLTSALRRCLSLAVIGALAACGGADSSTGTAPAPAKTAVGVQLSWFHSIEFAGIYEGIRQGSYAEAGLDVRVDDGGIGADGTYIDPVARVVGGQAEFGVAGADVVLRARAGGAPIVAIAAIYQRSPVGIMSTAGAKIAKPEDLVGRKVGIAPQGTTVYISYRALLQSKGIDPASISEVPVDPAASVEALFKGEIDALHTFVTHEAVQGRARASDVNVMVLSDYGIDIYSNVLFTTEKLIAEKPALVEGFVRGTVKGLQWAADHPDEAAANVNAVYGAKIPPPLQQIQQAGMQAAVPLIRPAGSQPGMMSAQNWESAHKVLLDQQLIMQPLDVKAAYNLSFLEKAYQQ